jgi:hypothetical protein
MSLSATLGSLCTKVKKSRRSITVSSVRRHRHRIRAPRLAVEQRDLAENLPGMKEIEHRFPAIDRRDRDLHRPRADGEQGGARVALRKDGHSGRNPARPRVGA